MCSKYRGVTLFSLSGNVYSGVLEKRVCQIAKLGFRRRNVVFVLDVKLWTTATTSAGSWRVCGLSFVDVEMAIDRVV